MRPAIASCLLAAALPAGAASGAWSFRVFLDTDPIGEHRFTLAGEGAERELRSEARFDVRVLFVSVYRYQHSARERWEGDCLRSLDSSTQTNSERRAVRAATRSERLEVERPEAREAHEGCVMSFAYWNPEILKAKRLLNSETGEYLPVRISARGEETIAVRGEPMSTRRHRIEAPGLQIDLWYAGPRWVALEAPAKGGRRLRYELM